MKLAKKVALPTKTLALTSCARQISSQVYYAKQERETSLTYSGTIKNTCEVDVEQSEQLDNNQLGIAGGRVDAGLLENVLGRGKFFPTATGAVTGTIASLLVEKKLKRQRAFEYAVELNDGGFISVVQGREDATPIGLPVYVIVSQSGCSRLTLQ